MLLSQQRRLNVEIDTLQAEERMVWAEQRDIDFMHRWYPGALTVGALIVGSGFTALFLKLYGL